MGIDLQIVEKLCSHGVTNKIVIALLEMRIPGISKKLSEKLSRRAFENLLYRQLYFLLKNKEYTRFLDSINYLSSHIDLIIRLLERYHYEFIFRDYGDGSLIFREEVIATLTYHDDFRGSLAPSLRESVTYLSSFPLFSIVKNPTETLTISLAMKIFDEKNDFQDGMNAITLSVETPDQWIYTLCFYVGEEEILISNLQYWKWAKSYIIVERYSRVLLYLLLKIAKYLGKPQLRSFSNANHPCKHHDIHSGFRGDYDNICRSLGMNMESNYFYAHFDTLHEPLINPFIRENIDENLSTIYRSIIK